MTTIRSFKKLLGLPFSEARLLDRSSFALTLLMCRCTRLLGLRAGTHLTTLIGEEPLADDRRAGAATFLAFEVVVLAFAAVTSALTS